MEIVMRKPADLIGAEYNPRELTDKQFRDLKDSLQRFGFVDPILVNKNKDRKDIIVGGHQRTRVAEDLGIKEVPTVEVDLTLEQEKELNIRLNKNSGQWDMDALANYFDAADLVDWGFTTFELDYQLDVDEENKEENFKPMTYVLKVDCEDEIQLKALKDELEEKGYICGE